VSNLDSSVARSDGRVGGVGAVGAEKVRTRPAWASADCSGECHKVGGGHEIGGLWTEGWEAGVLADERSTCEIGRGVSVKRLGPLPSVVVRLGWR
jgi:hypothetical protein